MDSLLRYGTRDQVRDLVASVRETAICLGSYRLVDEADAALLDLEDGHMSVAVGVQGFVVTDKA